MTEWTDLDYAQAAIDMLPGSVEEIDTFIKAQGITRIQRGVPIVRGCPVSQWVNRWTDNPANVNFTVTHSYSWGVKLPVPVQEYVLYVDRNWP